MEATGPTLPRRRVLGLLGLGIGAALVPQLLRPGAAVAGTRPFVHGVATADLASVRAFEAATGRFARSFTYYRSWGAPVDLAWEAGFVRQLVARGTTPVLTLQPQDPGGGVDQPRYAHARILAGDFDPLLRDWARVLRGAGGEVVVRPMHEGNGDWYPWCATVNGNTPASYVAAWRRIRLVFRLMGATNVRWQWSVNKVFPGSTPLAALFPGEGRVDEVGLSGYNGGTVVDRGGWRSFGEIFGATVAEVRALTGRPVHIAETSSASGGGGDRVAWIDDMWSWLAAHPEVAGMTWFDVDKGHVDWRLATSPEAVAAYRRGAVATVPPRA